MAFQTYVEQTGKFANVVFVRNTAKNTTDRNGVQYFVDSSTFRQLAACPRNDRVRLRADSALDTPGRYVLGKLGEKLRRQIARHLLLEGQLRCQR